MRITESTLRRIIREEASYYIEKANLLREAIACLKALEALEGGKLDPELKEAMKKLLEHLGDDGEVAVPPWAAHLPGTYYRKKANLLGEAIASLEALKDLEGGKLDRELEDVMMKLRDHLGDASMSSM